MKQSKKMEQITDLLKTEVKQLTQEVEVLRREGEVHKLETGDLKLILNCPSSFTKLHWRITNIQKLLKTDYIFSLLHSEQFQDTGYNFLFKLRYGFDPILINFCPEKGVDYDKLNWPFKAEFVTRLVCHHNPKASKEFRSKLIELEKRDYIDHKELFGITIARIPKSCITAEFIKDGCIDLDIFVIMRKLL